ncbi:MAG TPA: pyridoxine 5'-phosphate synthase [Bacteroidales bacterium]|nr:pyridoxine 5'-phosphate synthase [Bacteroidales bacterium]
MTNLSVNVNKFATLRNARGGNMPDVVQAVKDCERFGAQGITVHPRPDERHIRYRDVREIKPVITTEFNIEGNPIPSFIELVLEIRPAQVTLVPDAHDVITSNAGWDTIRHKDALKDWVKVFKNAGIRVSLFVDPDPEMIKAAAITGADRVELYTESYAHLYETDREKAIRPYITAAQAAARYSLGLNAGHDLNLTNIAYFQRNIPGLLEVSIGHALICESIYLGLENTIQMYLRQLSDF